MAQGFKPEEPQRSFLSTVSSSEVSCTSATLEVEGPSAEPGGASQRRSLEPAEPSDLSFP